MLATRLVSTNIFTERLIQLRTISVSVSSNDFETAARLEASAKHTYIQLHSPYGTDTYRDV